MKQICYKSQSDTIRHMTYISKNNLIISLLTIVKPDDNEKLIVIDSLFRIVYDQTVIANAVVCYSIFEEIVDAHPMLD